MAVSLGNLNISIDLFAAASNGKYNIGQIKLGADGTSVQRVNNHKTLTFLNTVKISAEESFAVRNAFANALAKAGVPEASMQEVRKELGLDTSALSLVRLGELKPLSADTVRTIIDKYSGEINSSRSTDNAIKTREDLFGAESSDVQYEYSAIRDRVNDATLKKADFKASARIEQFATILGSVMKNSPLNRIDQGIATEILKIACKEPEFLQNPKAVLTLKSAPDVHIGLSGENGTVVAKFDLPDGNTIDIDTHLTRKEFLSQLEQSTAGTGKIVEPGSGGIDKSEDAAPREPGISDKHLEELAEKKQADQKKIDAHEERIAQYRKDYAADKVGFAKTIINGIDKVIAKLEDPGKADDFSYYIPGSKSDGDAPETPPLRKPPEACSRISSNRIKVFQDKIAPKVQDALNIVRGRGEENTKLLNRLNECVRSGDYSNLPQIKADIRKAIVGEPPKEDYNDNFDKPFKIDDYLASSQREEDMNAFPEEVPETDEEEVGESQEQLLDPESEIE